jgi:putative DNA primase/helicase
MLTSTNSQGSEVSRVQGIVFAGLPATSEALPEVSPPTTTPQANSVVPGQIDRPCYRVFDDPQRDGDDKFRAGVWYFGIKASKGEAPPTLFQQWVCSPMHIDAVTTDHNAGNYGRLLRFRTTLGKWRTWAMPMELLRGDGSDLRGELLSMGVEIDPHGRQVLASYLQAIVPKRRIECALQTGWAGTDFKAFVLPDEVIGPKASAVTYQTGERGHDEYTTAGTLKGWQAGVAALAVGNPLLALALSAAFAGPVLARCNSESGGIHFIGDSSTGKTTAIEAACSVWGGANFKRSWRATGNGMEGVAALFNDSLLALDEISECDPREVGAIVYALGNGRGKQRASRTGQARSVARWRCSVLSSGERSIGTTMAEGGHRVKAGQSVRLLDVPATRAHGAWDTLHQFQSGTALSDALKRQSTTHFGHAGRAFLQRLSRAHDADFCIALDKIKARPEFASPDDEGQARRAASRFAVLALAGELATNYGVTGWPADEAIRAAAAGFAAWRRLRGQGRGNLERDQVVERMSSFIERHGDSRFSDVACDDEKLLSMVRDRAGWWVSVSGQRRYLFTADGMREALKGFDFARALDALQEAGAIDPPAADGKRAKFRRIRGSGMKLYTVDPSKLEMGA